MSRDEWRLVGDELIVAEARLLLPEPHRQGTSKRARLEQLVRRANEDRRAVQYLNGARCRICGGVDDLE